MTTNIFNLSDTWASSGTIFEAIFVNVKNNASAAGSSVLRVSIDGVTLFKVDKSGFVAVGSQTPNRLLHVESDTGLTNDVNPIIRMTSVSTGTPAAGIGVGMEFEVQTAVGNKEVGATIDVITTNITPSSEAFELVFTVMVGGATPTDVLRLSSVVNAVNQVSIVSSGTGTAPLIVAVGTDTDISLSLAGKGTGSIVLSGFVYPTADGSSGDVITTDGAGNFTLQAGGIKNVVEDITPQYGGNMDVNGFSLVSVSTATIRGAVPVPELTIET